MVAHSFLLVIACLSFVSAALHKRPHHRRSNLSKRTLGLADPVFATSPAKRAPPAGWSYIGCAADSSSNRLMSTRKADSTTQTVNKCITACNGFKYAGLEAGNQCYCTNTLNAPSPLGEANCGTNCRGDATIKCGGTNAVSVYSTNAKYTYSALGCWVDAASPRTLSGYTWTSTSMTPWKCQMTCNFRNFAYAGVENGNECHCASTFTKGTKVADSQCATKCVGDTTKICGGGWRLSVFGAPGSGPTTTTTTTTTTTSTSTTSSSSSTTSSTTTSTTSTPTGTFVRKGCYVDSATRVLPVSAFQSDTMTIASCQEGCRNYLYAGTEYGRECYCANSFPANLNPVADSECNLPCKGDTATTCGAGWRIEVYERQSTTTTTTTTTSTSSTTTGTSTPTLGTSCTAPLTPLAAASDPYWMQEITHDGKSPYNPNPSTYKPWRNVKDYGAVGDGIKDDTAAINRAISDQNRCGQGCKSSTRSPGIIYFPKGTYLVSSPIIPYYYTQLVGDPKSRPILLAAVGFNGIAVIDADPYLPGGGQWWVNQNNFFKSVRNFVIDLRRMPVASSATGIHWQVSQATTLINVEVQMSQNSATNHQGIYMENGSGGFMSDLVFIGGKYGIFVGNQQFTVRNIRIENSRTAIFVPWSFGWTWQGVTIKNCNVGFELPNGGSEVIVDGDIQNVATFIKLAGSSGKVLLDNIKFSSVGKGVVDGNSATVMAGGTRTVRQWAQGNKYSGTSTSFQSIQADVVGPTKPAAILDSNGNIFGRSRPTYSNYLASQFVRARAEGAKGDGVTDDTAAIQSMIDKYWGCKIIYFDAGTYIVTDTIKIPTGTIVVGEVWSTVMGSGSAFADMESPRAVIQVGNPGEKGIVEISDMVFTTRAGAAGAIVLEWNTADIDGQKATAAMWDVHIRLGGFAGTNMLNAQCAKFSGHAIKPCTAAFIGIHITKTASVYAEGTWVWTADHSLDEADHSEPQIDVYTGRGIVSESIEGPVWLIGTGSEHHAIVQYSFVNSKNVYAGLIQTETPYYQPGPDAPQPFTISSTYHDPTISNGPSAWSTYIKNSEQIFIYGAGLYSFFDNYSQDCTPTWSCQNSIVKVDSASKSIYIYGLTTIGSTNMLNVDTTPIIKQIDNRNGFASTATLWTKTS